MPSVHRIGTPGPPRRRTVLKQQARLFSSLLMAIDGAVLALAAVVAWIARELVMRQYAPGYPQQWWPVSWEEYVKQPLVLFTVPIGIAMMSMFGLYRARRDRTMLNELLQIAKASLTTAALLVIVLWVVGNSVIGAVDAKSGKLAFLGMQLDAGRVQIAFLAVALVVLLGAYRVAFRLGLRSLRRRGWNLRHVAVIGCGRLGQIVAHTLERNAWTGLRVNYFISHQDTTRRTHCLDKPVLGGLNDLEDILSEQKPDAVYLALPGRQADRLGEILNRLERFPVDVRVVPDLNPRYLPQSMSVGELDGMPILSYRESPTQGLGGLTKRVLDILGATTALVLFSPIMLATAIAVRLSSPGPVIFKQRRVSLAGELFDIYKFRTMFHVEDESGKPRWTDRNDPRITRIGRFLRRTSIDELPQLFNVLGGSMSLVGPRPERPELIERFREDWRGYMLRQHVKAGITGWAQVNGLRGQTSLRKRLQFDLFYIRNWSLLFDVKILILTVFRGFVHRNAH